METQGAWRGWVALSLIPGLGNESFRRLLSAFGEPENIYAAGRKELEGVVKPNVAARIAQGIDEDSIQTTGNWLGDPANSILTLADEDYPPALLQIHDPPPILYLKGERGLLGRKCFAIVGSRNATPQGLKNAESFARSLSDAGFCVVSGLAIGIDAAAHEGGLRGRGGSIGVIGTGLDIVYPARNRVLAHELAKRGLLISEFPLGTPAMGTNFPRRNRIISGLAVGCLVVEAGLQSGSLITAFHALEQGKDVFAIPGSIHSPLSKGPHRLIKQGAKLVERAEDILGELGVDVSLPPAEDASSHMLLDQMGYDPVDADTLAERSGLPVAEVSALLLELELAARVKPMSGGLYQRI